MPPAIRPTRNTGPWSSSRILNPPSPIVNSDIYAYLVMVISGWNSDPNFFTEEEKQAVIGTLPPVYRKYEKDDKGRLRCPLSADFVFNDSYIRAAVQQFNNDIVDGHYEKTWQNKAIKAMQERREGKFDSYLHEQTEENFGDAGADDEEVVEDPTRTETLSSDSEWNNQKKVKRNSQSQNAVQTQMFLPALNF